MFYLIKFGGSLITKKNQYQTLNKKNINKLVRIISNNLSHKYIFVHGAGSYGHMPVLKYKINDGININNTKQTLGFCFTHFSVSQLSNELTNTFLKRKIPVLSLAPITLIKQSKKRIISFNSMPIKNALDLNLIPMLYGDFVFDNKLNGSVVSGDQIMQFIAKRFKPDLSIYLSDVPGVYNSNSQIIPVIDNNNFSKLKKAFGNAKNDITGGMFGKIKEIKKSKARSIITNMDNLPKILKLKKINKKHLKNLGTFLNFF